MDFNAMIDSLKTNANPVNVVLLVLLAISEVMGSNGSKASSIYNLIKAVLMTIRDQVWPAPAPAEPPKTTTA